MTNEVLHIDFYAVDVTKPIQATVPLHFIGKAEGVTAGGILQPLCREITVECLPRDIPQFLAVDVSKLAIHQSIHMDELVLPAGVKGVYDTNEPVVTVLPPIAPMPITTPSFFVCWSNFPGKSERPVSGACSL